MRLPARGAALIALASLAACNAASAADETLSSADASPDTRTAQTAAAAPVMTSPPAAAAPEAQGPATFLFDGELTQGGFIRGQVPAGTVSARLGETPLALGPTGRFFAAFDRDEGTQTFLHASMKDGRQVSVPVTVSPREWNIQRVNVAKREGGSSEAWWAKREPEWNAIVDARARKTGAEGWTQDFVWPVTGRISGLFGRQRIYRGEPGSYHSGIDIAPGNGVPFVAPADGVVVLARTGFSLEGNLIIIDHGAGLNSAFLHASRIVVEEGQAVTQGQHIGNVGASGRATGPHLHWSLKWHDARLDPLLFTGPMP
ncbi:M23 family metallopeptidase [Erythrobacteraceae bacterium WH01K]|nr:M23 family metallopeptidase [Erythrobacteraceae bacterium WH01K]